MFGRRYTHTRITPFQQAAIEEIAVIDALRPAIIVAQLAANRGDHVFGWLDRLDADLQRRKQALLVRTRDLGLVYRAGADGVIRPVYIAAEEASTS